MFRQLSDKDAIMLMFKHSADTIMKARKMLLAKMDKLDVELKLAQQNSNKDDTNMKLLCAKGRMLEEIYNSLEIVQNEINRTRRPNDIKEAKDMLTEKLNRATQVIADAKSLKEWQPIKEHRGILGLLDKILKLLTGELAWVKTASERVVDNASAMINRAKPS